MNTSSSSSNSSTQLTMDGIEVVVQDPPPKDGVGTDTTGSSDGHPLLVEKKNINPHLSSINDDNNNNVNAFLGHVNSSTNTIVKKTTATSTIILEQGSNEQSSQNDNNTSTNNYNNKNDVLMTTNNNNENNNITCRMTDEGIETIEIYDFDMNKNVGTHYNNIYDDNTTGKHYKAPLGADVSSSINQTTTFTAVQKVPMTKRTTDVTYNGHFDNEKSIWGVSTIRKPTIKTMTQPSKAVAAPPTLSTTTAAAIESSLSSSSFEVTYKKPSYSTKSGNNNNPMVDRNIPPTSSSSSSTNDSVQRNEESTIGLFHQKSNNFAIRKLDPNDGEWSSNSDLEYDSIMVGEATPDTKRILITTTTTTSSNYDSMRRQNKSYRNNGSLKAKKPAMKTGIFNQPSMDTFFIKNRKDERGVTKIEESKHNKSAAAGKPHHHPNGNNLREPGMPGKYSTLMETIKKPSHASIEAHPEGKVDRRLYSGTKDDSFDKKVQKEKFRKVYERLNNNDGHEETEEDVDNDETEDEEYDPNDWGLPIVRSYARSNGPAIHIAQGSVLDFRSRTGAIVNAANEECLFGGGVDGAITAAGGRKLALARLALPILSQVPIQKDEDDDDDNSEEGDDDSFDQIFEYNRRYESYDDSAGGKNKKIKTSVRRRRKVREVRCWTGGAVLTGPKKFGSIHVPYVVHAVGPNYWDFPTRDGHELLFSAYQRTLDVTSQVNAQFHTKNITNSNIVVRNPIPPIQHIAFCLLSAGIFRAKVPLPTILDIGISAILQWKPPKTIHPERSLQNIILCGFTKQECSLLVKICDYHLPRPDRPTTRSI